MNIRIEFSEREQYLLSHALINIFGGGSSAVIQNILGKGVESASLLEPKLKAQINLEHSSIELTAHEWRIMYEALNAVIYGLGPCELHTITGFTLQEACDVNLKICVAVWGAHSNSSWQEVLDFRSQRHIT